jgi:hypothetical protein
MAELHAARVLHKFLVAAGKMVSGSLTSLTKLQADRPDVLLETVNGRRIGIEVTELLDPDAVKRHRMSGRFIRQNEKPRPSTCGPGILVVVTRNFLHEHHDPAPQGGIINSHERSDQL